jgi:hypothetical protein
MLEPVKIETLCQHRYPCGGPARRTDNSATREHGIVQQPQLVVLPDQSLDSDSFFRLDLGWKIQRIEKFILKCWNRSGKSAMNANMAFGDPG